MKSVALYKAVHLLTGRIIKILKYWCVVYPSKSSFKSTKFPNYLTGWISDRVCLKWIFVSFLVSFLRKWLRKFVSEPKKSMFWTKRSSRFILGRAVKLRHKVLTKRHTKLLILSRGPNTWEIKSSKKGSIAEHGRKSQNRVCRTGSFIKFNTWEWVYKKRLGLLTIRARNRSKERHATQLSCVEFSKPDFNCGVFTWISLI